MDKTKILVICDNFGLNVPGGSAKSITNIVESLKQVKYFSIDIWSPKSKLIKQGSFLSSIDIIYYLFIPKILRVIRKFEPNIIIAQGSISYPTIICAKLMKVPIINIIRDVSCICPKKINIIKQYKSINSCIGLVRKPRCYKCIEEWRTLRVLLGDRNKDWIYSLRNSIYTVWFKLRFYVVRFNIWLMKQAKINLVASPRMKDILTLASIIKKHDRLIRKISYMDELWEWEAQREYINLKSETSKRFKVLNVVPISSPYSEFWYYKDKGQRFYKMFRLDENNKLESYMKIGKSYNNKISFITPICSGFYKGENFVIELAKEIKNCRFNIIGRKIDNKLLLRNIVNYDFLRSERLDRIYFESDVILVPSIWTEAFGRVIIESLINKTPVISSPECGVNAFFKNNEMFLKTPYLRVVELKKDLWVDAIKDMLKNPVEITNQDVEYIYSKFSMEKCKDDFTKLIKEVII